MKRRSHQGSQVTDLQGVVKELRGTFIAVAVFSFFVNALMLVVPFYMLQMYDRVLSSRSHSTLAMLTIVAVFLLVMYGLLDLVRSRVLVRSGIRLDRRLNSRVFSAVLVHGLRTSEGRHAQALQDLGNLRQLLSSGSLVALFDSPWVPLFLGIIFLFHPVLGTVALVGALVLFGLALVNAFVTRGAFRQASEQSIVASGFAESSLRNVEVLRAMGMLSGLRRRWLDKHETALAHQAQANDRGGAITSSSKFVRLLVQISVLGTGGYLAIEQVITPGVMIASAILMSRALMPLEQAVGQWRNYVNARAAYDRLNKLLNATRSDQPPMVLPAPKGLVSLERAVAVPPNTKVPVLKGLSFKLEAGEALGVIGPSGAGKSTLGRLLVGVWAPQGGAVRLDGADVSSWDPDQLGPHIGYLPQDVELFEGTIAENIERFGEHDPGKVVEAAELAGVHDLVLHLPQGYDTAIGEDGRALSAGQRQRVGLARALYGDPCLVVLDEPNSNLDTDGEQALQQALQSLKNRGATVVLIAHRPAIMASVDRILVLQNGTMELLAPREKVMERFRRVTPIKAAAARRIPPAPMETQ